MSGLREYALSSAYDSVIAKANLRRPQQEAFEKFHQLMRAFGRDISAMSQEEIAERVDDLGFDADIPPNLLFDLATGVGKTKLLGSILVYLARSKQTRNCLILAPRVAILDKFKRESDSSSSKYLFLDKSLVSNPNICFGSDLLSFQPDASRLNVFILSPQTITGDRRRFATKTDFGPAIREYLTKAGDLVVFADEAHHLGNGDVGAWREAVSTLRPKLCLGFTATVPDESRRKILYSYSLSACLKEAKFTKAVKLWVEPKPDDIEEEDWDHQTIDFAINRLEAKRAAISELRAIRPGFPDVSPVLLVAAKDIAHAERVGQWLRKSRNFEDDEVLVAHSGTVRKAGSNLATKERTISRLVSIDLPGNRIKVVVNVFQLSEGWDVTNVWVVAPLRSLATFSNAIQTIGRGLRLPSGRRTGESEVDSLDVLCFGKEDFRSIVDDAIRQFGDGLDGSATIEIVRKSEHHVRLTKPVTVNAVKNVSFAIPQVTRIPGEPELDFSAQITHGISSYVEVYDVGTGEFGTEDGTPARRDFDAVVRAATSQVLDSLRFLDPIKHGVPVKRIVQRVLEDMGGKPETEISTDSVKLALGVIQAIKARYQSNLSSYKAAGPAASITFDSQSLPMPVEFEDFPSKDSANVWK